jgi:hypothetical protein
LAVRLQALLILVGRSDERFVAPSFSLRGDS